MVLQLDFPQTAGGQRAGEIDSSRRIRAFLDEPSFTQSIRIWIGDDRLKTATDLRTDIVRQFHRDIAAIDVLLADQVNAILHHPVFQQLEATWRGVQYLVERRDRTANTKIKILNLTWRELSRDVTRAIDFDQSNLFEKIYTDEFGMPGGEPYGLLIGDYYLTHRSSRGDPTDHIDAAERLAEISAAAFSPLVVSADSSLFGLNDFAELEQPTNFDKVFSQNEYSRWNQLRTRADVRFFAVTLPRMLMRRPYIDSVDAKHQFCFEENLTYSGQNAYLWGNAVYAFGAVVLRSFEATSWLADVRGIVIDEELGGLVQPVCVDYLETDVDGLMPKIMTEVAISDKLEGKLSELGFLPLSSCKNTHWSAYYSSQSVQRPQRYESAIANMNAKLSANLQHVLCTSRFAQYIKVIVRDKVGTFTTPQEVERELNEWLLGYCTQADDITDEMKARYPLREGKVEVRERAGRPGDFACVIHLQPQFRFDQFISSIRLQTEIGLANPAG